MRAMEKLSESEQRTAARPLARVAARMVRLLPAGGRSLERDELGRVDSTAHPVLLLAAVAQRQRSGANPAGAGHPGATTPSGPQQPRRMVPCRQCDSAKSTLDRTPKRSRLPDAVRS